MNFCSRNQPLKILDVLQASPNFFNQNEAILPENGSSSGTGHLIERKINTKNMLIENFRRLRKMVLYQQ
jgi:hypothetical protein